MAQSFSHFKLFKKNSKVEVTANQVLACLKWTNLHFLNTYYFTNIQHGCAVYIGELLDILLVNDIFQCYWDIIVHINVMPCIKYL